MENLSQTEPKQVVLIVLPIVLLIFIVLCIHPEGRRRLIFFLRRKKLKGSAGQKSTLSPEQAQCLAFGAVLSGYEGMQDDDLFEQSNTRPLKKVKKRLSRRWSIHNRECALVELNWRKNGGHHCSRRGNFTSYDDILDVCMGRRKTLPNGSPPSDKIMASFQAAKNALIQHFQYTEAELSAVTTVAAWDIDTLIYLARASYGLGYLTQDEAWQYITAGAELGAQYYRDWRGYMAGIFLGYAIWLKESRFRQSYINIGKALLKDPAGVYRRIAFPKSPVKSAPPKNTLTPVQERQIAFGAVLSEINGMHHLDLFETANLFPLEEVREGLSENWSIVDHQTAIRQLESLRTGGHHRRRPGLVSHDDLLDVLMGRRDRLPGGSLPSDRITAAFQAAKKGLMNSFQYSETELSAVTTLSAWDYDRMVRLARVAYGVGYLSKEEAWYYIAAGAELGAPDYKDWRGYFAGVVLGYALWWEEPEFSERHRMAGIGLLKGENSIYRRVPFKAPAAF